MIVVVSTFVAEVTVNVPVVAPAAIVTDAGGVAWPFDAVSATTRPPVGAGLEIVSVPVEFVPELTVLGFSARLTKVGAVTVIELVVPRPLAVPETVTVVFEATATVVNAKVAVFDPAGTVTVPVGAAMVDIAALLGAKETTVPPVGATSLSVTVPVPAVPPTIVAGSVTLDTIGSTTVNVAVCGVPLDVAVIVTDVGAGTTLVVTVNAPVVLPAGIETVAGTEAAAGLLDERLIVRPPVGAGSFRVTVPAIGVPPGLYTARASDTLCTF
jgi:hypothetical protein